MLGVLARRIHETQSMRLPQHVFIPAGLDMALRRPWLSAFRTLPKTPAPRAHLDFQARRTRSGSAPDLAANKTLVIFDPIRNTSEVHSVLSCEIRVSLHDPLRE
jgi:hypothetical protein